MVTADELAEACDTHVPAAEEGTKKGKWSVHRSLIVDAIERAKTQWQTIPCEPCALPNPCQGLDSKKLLRSVRCKAQPVSCEQDNVMREPEVQKESVNITAMKNNVNEWVGEVAENGCNAKQTEVCRKVAGQVMQEMCLESCGAPEPLRWAVHGGPGTGKSYVLNRIRKELFEEILGWKQGAEFQVVTLQAVMANDLKGDTIHHAFGLNWQGLGDERISGHKLLELSARALRWRWLIIDEISMVSAELLARLELRCRELVRDLA